MKPFNRLLHSTTAKTNWALIIILLVAAGFLFGFVKIQGVDFSQLHLPFGVTGGGTQGMVNVTKRIQFSFTDKYSGGALDGDTFYVYSASGALLESLTTDGDGVQETAKTYASGTHLDILYHQGNALRWYSLTVPQMSAADAQGSTYNNVNYEAFTIGTYTSDVLRSGAVTLGDGDTWNASDNENPIFNYELSNTGADNTGLMNSYDPVYGQNLRVCIVVTISGTGYERVIPSGFDTVFTLGSTTYAVMYYSPEALTKWKVGSTYQSGYAGTDSRSFSLDLTGILEADAPTVQINAYAYADPSYAATHGGNLGHSYVLIAEQTMLIDDGP